jgi:pimeloyl-ACP methyl ester carboxylesterase
MRQKFDVARTGQGWEQFQDLMKTSSKEAWFQTVNAPDSLEGLLEARAGQFSYDPNPDLVNLRIPVLAIFGERDTGTPAKQIAATTKSALSKARNKNNRIVIIPGATHGPIIFPEDRKPWFFFRFADGCMPLMTDWALKRLQD